MSDNPTFPDNELIEQELVAYLDGELDSSESDRVERRLADDASYRAHLQKLQRAWDMLDFLPRADINEAFTKSTVEMVAVKAEQEVSKKQSWLFNLRRPMWVTAAASVVGGLLVGYGVISWIVSAPDRTLVRDLPVIENVDLYYHVDSIEFLQELDQAGLFADEVEESGHAT